MPFLESPGFGAFPNAPVKNLKKQTPLLKFYKQIRVEGACGSRRVKIKQ